MNALLPRPKTAHAAARMCEPKEHTKVTPKSSVFPDANESRITAAVKTEESALAGRRKGMLVSKSTTR